LTGEGMELNLGTIIFVMLVLTNTFGLAICFGTFKILPSEEEQKRNAYYYLVLMKESLGLMVSLWITVLIILIVMGLALDKIF
jgi:hypothetical protein